MPRRELLTPAERAQLFAFPEDEGELIRLATLSRADLTYIRHHRGDHNRLGLAVQMTYLRHPSRVIAPREAPHPPLLGIVAAQLKVTRSAWSLYATRDETRREHLQELLERFRLRQFDRTLYRELIEWLTPMAMQTTQGLVLAHAVANELRSRHILLPTVALIEKICATALTRLIASAPAPVNDSAAATGGAKFTEASSKKSTLSANSETEPIVRATVNSIPK